MFISISLFYLIEKRSKFDLKAVSEYIVPHKGNDKLLWCKITESALNKVPEEIMRHVNGKKYLRCYRVDLLDSYD